MGKLRLRKCDDGKREAKSSERYLICTVKKRAAKGAYPFLTDGKEPIGSHGLTIERALSEGSEALGIGKQPGKL